MKKLFILLSILAITTPSYACGCGGNKPFELILMAFFAFLFIIFPSFIVYCVSSEEKCRQAFSNCGASLVWTALAGIGLGTFISSSIVSSFTILIGTLICMLVIFLGFFIKALHKRPAFHEEPTN